jgi:hypothetical protein
MVVRKPHLSSQVFAHLHIYPSNAMVFYEKRSEGYHSCCVSTQIQVLKLAVLDFDVKNLTRSKY